MAPVTVEPAAALLGSTNMPNSPAGSHRPPDLYPRENEAKAGHNCRGFRLHRPPGRALGMINYYGKRGLNGGHDMSVQTALRHKRGGLYFEDFAPGEVVEHRYTRTVTQMDNM